MKIVLVFSAVLLFVAGIAVAVEPQPTGTPTSYLDDSLTDSPIEDLNSLDEDNDDDDDGDEVTSLMVDPQDYMKAKDTEFINEIDEWMAAHLEKREKRWVPLVVGGARVAWSVGRALMRGAARGGITRSGSRITQHYNRNGSYRTALRNFSNLKPTNVRPTTSRNGSIRGYTGQVGRYRVTVRNGSSTRNGATSRPTMEIRGGRVVRKFRYNRN